MTLDPYDQTLGDIPVEFEAARLVVLCAILILIGAFAAWQRHREKIEGEWTQHSPWTMRRWQGDRWVYRPASEQEQQRYWEGQVW